MRNIRRVSTHRKEAGKRACEDKSGAFERRKKKQKASNNGEKGAL